MGSICIGYGVGCTICKKVECSDVIFGKNGIKLLIEHVKQDLRACDICRQGMKTHLEHGRHQGRRNTVSGYVCNDKSGHAMPDVHHIIQIAADVNGGYVLG